MEEMQKPLLIIVNRCYPPHEGITGTSAFELAKFLQNKSNIEIKAVCIADNYGNLHSDYHPSHEVVALQPFYSGKKKLPRLFSSVIESINMIRTAKKMTQGRKKVGILVMTEPPLLNFFGSFLLRNNFYWGLWSMDLYPEAFHSSGIVSRQHFLFRRIHNVLKKYHPAFIIALGHAQQQFIKKVYQWNSDFFIIPCGIRSLPQENLIQPDWAKTEKIIFGYCGNVGEAHNDKFILDCIRSLNPDEHLFIASLYGSKARELEVIIKDFPYVIFKDNVTPEELSFIDVHLVSLLNKWVHVCVPSKVVSGVCMGSSFLYNGSPDGDNWKYLANAGWRINQNYPISDLKQLIASIDKSTIYRKRRAATQISSELNEGRLSEFNRFLHYLEAGVFMPDDEVVNSAIITT